MSLPSRRIDCPSPHPSTWRNPIESKAAEERLLQEVRGLARGERVYGARTSNIAETDPALGSANRGFILTPI